MYLITILLTTIFIDDLKAQTDSMNIWKITNSFLVENGERSVNAYPYPRAEGEYFVYPFFIFSSDGEISDPKFSIPQTKKINYYSFGILNPHQPKHLLFVKNATWFIINMQKPLPEIMNQAVELCRVLVLNDKDSLYVFSTVLRYNEGDSKNTGGASIIE